MIAKPGGHDTSKRKRREEGGRKREVTRRNKGNEVLWEERSKIKYEKEIKIILRQKKKKKYIKFISEKKNNILKLKNI